MNWQRPNSQSPKGLDATIHRPPLSAYVSVRFSTFSPGWRTTNARHFGVGRWCFRVYYFSKTSFAQEIGNTVSNQSNGCENPVRKNHKNIASDAACGRTGAGRRPPFPPAPISFPDLGIYRTSTPKSRRSCFSFSAPVKCTACQPAAFAPSTFTSVSSMKRLLAGLRSNSFACRS